VGGQKPYQGLSFTSKYNGRARSLHTPVNVESAINPDVKIKIDALWDTGAGSSLIRPEVASQLHLQPVSKTLISTPSDKDVPSNVYLIHIYLPKFADLQGAETYIDKTLGCVPLGVEDDDIETAIGDSIRLSVDVLDGKVKNVVGMKGE